MVSIEKVKVFNYLELPICEITTRASRKLIDNDYAQVVTYNGESGILTKAETKSEFSKMLKIIKKSDVIQPTTKKCWRCGKEVATQNNKKRPFCEECKVEIERQHDQDLKIYLNYRAKFMLDKAMRIIENQMADIDIEEYKEPYEVVKEAMEDNPEKFDSSHEAAAAIELLRNRVEIKTHKKIANHVVDFLLPEFKAILEIDGYMHKHSLEKDYKIDNALRNELGNDWEVIRISTEHIEKNIYELLDAIIAMKKYKTDIRRDHSGVLPEWFSARDNKVWNKIAYK